MCCWTSCSRTLVCEIRMCIIIIIIGLFFRGAFTLWCILLGWVASCSRWQTVLLCGNGAWMRSFMFGWRASLVTVLGLHEVSRVGCRRLRKWRSSYSLFLRFWDWKTCTYTEQGYIRNFQCTRLSQKKDKTVVFYHCSEMSTMFYYSIWSRLPLPAFQ